MLFNMNKMSFVNGLILNYPADDKENDVNCYKVCTNEINDSKSNAKRGNYANGNGNCLKNNKFKCYFLMEKKEKEYKAM